MSMPRQPGADAFDFLSAQLIDAIQAWSVPGPAWEESALDDWARQAFRLQYAGNASYAKYCHARGVGPSDVSGWRDFVPVPTAAFRVVDLIVGRPSDARLIFLTSGTTRGPSARGRHLVRSPELYRASLRAAFRVFVLRGDESAKLIALPPSFTHDANSSLGWMLDDVRSGIGSGDGVSVARATGIDWEALGLEIRQAAEAGRAVCLLGTSLGLAEWLDRLRDGRSAEVRLPAGSVLMDTGGEKGRPGLARSDIVRDLAPRLGLTLDCVVNEFGMTELLSQRYGRGDPAVPLLAPPWLRSQVLDPLTLQEVPEGEVGILCHFDLANLGSVCSVLTEDRGRKVGDGIEWVGRTEGAPPRGCSLATAELLEAQARA
jgi:hypothetical protein